MKQELDQHEFDSAIRDYETAKTLMAARHLTRARELVAEVIEEIESHDRAADELLNRGLMRALSAADGRLWELLQWTFKAATAEELDRQAA
jgi:hypothetical protein